MAPDHPRDAAMPEPFHNDTDDYVSPSASTADNPALPSAPLEISCAARSHRGRVRENNEDHYLVAKVGRSLSMASTNLPPELIPAPVRVAGCLMIVADGMGGMAAGELASRTAITRIYELIAESPHWALKIDAGEVESLFARIRSYFQAMDAQLIAMGRANPEWAGMGTTFLAAYCVGDNLFIGHAGDSRAYLLRLGNLERLTRDHTLAQALADEGRIAPEDVPNHPRRNVLTNYLGGKPDNTRPELHHIRLAPGDRLLLCTDGLHDVLEDPTIADLLRRHADPDSACDALLSLALAREAPDNVTLVIAEFRPGA